MLNRTRIEWPLRIPDQARAFTNAGKQHQQHSSEQSSSGGGSSAVAFPKVWPLSISQLKLGFRVETRAVRFFFTMSGRGP
jgi:hypothetical protein